LKHGYRHGHQTQTDNDADEANNLRKLHNLV